MSQLQYRNRSSHRRCSVRKALLGNFAKFRGKHLCLSLFFNKIAGRPATLLKKRLRHRCFPVNFAKFLITLSLQNTSETLLLQKHKPNLFLNLYFNLPKKQNCTLGTRTVSEKKKKKSTFYEDLLVPKILKYPDLFIHNDVSTASCCHCQVLS